MAVRKGQGGKRPAQRTAAAQPSPSPVAADQQAAASPEAVAIDADAGRFPVLSPLRFNGRRYRPEDPEANEVVMPRDQAAALQPIGVLGDELT